MSKHTDLAELADEYARKVAWSAAKGMPKRVDDWERFDAIVDPPSERFLGLLAELREGNVFIEPQVKAAGNEVVKAFRRASNECRGTRRRRA